MKKNLEKYLEDSFSYKFIEEVTSRLDAAEVNISVIPSVVKSVNNLVKHLKNKKEITSSDIEFLISKQEAKLKSDILKSIKNIDESAIYSYIQDTAKKLQDKVDNIKFPVQELKSYDKEISTLRKALAKLEPLIGKEFDPTELEASLLDKLQKNIKSTTKSVYITTAGTTIENVTGLQDALNAKQGTLTLTTTGSSGAATLIGDVLNIPQYSGGSGGSPAGSDTQVQFNDASSFGADADFTYNKTTNALTVGGLVTTPIIQAASSAGAELRTNSGSVAAHWGSGGSANGTLYGGWNYDNGTANTLLSLGASKTLTSLSTATYPSLTEIAYVKGVTSAIQTQIDTKADSSFKTIAVSGQSNIVADSATDTLTIAAGSGVSITTDAATDTLTISATGSGGSILLQTNGTDNGDQTKLNLVAGSNVTLTDNGTGSVTIAASGGGSSGGVSLLAQSNTAASVTGTTTETTLATYTLPANTLGANGVLRITVNFTKNTTSAGAATLRTRFGGASGTAYQSGNMSTAIGLAANIIYIIANNSTSSQKGYSGPTTNTTTYVTSSENTTSNIDIVFSGQLVNSADTLSLSSYTIELIKA